MITPENTIVLLAGMSGSGKTTVADELCKKFHGKSVASYTTRPMREGESNGTGHVFISDEEFDRIPEDDMVAYTEFDGHRYCATQKQVEDALVYVIDLAGIKEFHKKYKGNKNILTVFLDLYMAEREKKKKKRGDSSDMILARLENDKKMFQGIEDWTDVTIDANRPVQEIVQEIASMICINPEPEDSYDAVFVVKPLDDGMNKKDIRGLLELIDDVRVIPLEVQGESGAAMGFLSLDFAEMMDYDYVDSSEFQDIIKKPIDEMQSGHVVKTIKYKSWAFRIYLTMEV